MLRSSFLIVLFSLFVINAGAQSCTEVGKEYANLTALFTAKGFKIKKSKETAFVSGTETNETINLTAGKEYVILLVTEKMIDQSGISILNRFGLIVVSNFKETGSDRHLVMVQYKPVASGDYTLALKTIDFLGRTVCGYWCVFERDVQ